MTRKERIIRQRALLAEAFGKIDAATEHFGLDDEADFLTEQEEFKRWEKRVLEFKGWVWEESPIA